MDDGFAQQVAVVTGAGRGIGAATAVLLAQRGAKVALLSRNQRELEQTAERIAAACGTEHPAALIVPTDVTEEAQVESAFARIRAHFGPVRILINNAGFISPAPLAEMTLENWEQTLAVNLRGSFLCARAAFRQMQTAGQGGSIVNISSLSGIHGATKFPGFCAYGASKAGLIGFSDCLSVEGKPHGIRVNVVAPGAVDTQMLRRAAPFLNTRTLPADIAEVIVFVADSRRAHTLTGAVLEVNSNE